MAKTQRYCNKKSAQKIDAKRRNRRQRKKNTGDFYFEEPIVIYDTNYDWQWHHNSDQGSKRKSYHQKVEQIVEFYKIPKSRLNFEM